MKLYDRLNPFHWVLAFFSNSRKNTYLHEGTLHVVDSPYQATQRILYWFRNPMHDFTHYIIGFDGDPRWNLKWGYRVGQDTGFRAAIYGLGKIPFPWIAYDGMGVRIELGWNDCGNLKMKIRRNSV